MDLASVTHEGITVESNTATEAEMRTSLGVGESTEQVTEQAEAVSEAAPPANETAEEQAARERDEKGRFAKPGDDKKPVKPAQPRIDTLTWEREEARREAARERATREDLERRLAALEAGKPPEKREVVARVAEASDPEPTEDKFEDYQKFVDAHARWSARDEIRQERATQARQSAQSRREGEVHQTFSEYAGRMQEAVTADPQFFEKLSPDVLALKPLEMLSRDERPGPLNALASEIARSAHSAKLLQHFTDHPEDLRRFAALQPRDFLREFVRVETRLDTAPTQATVSKPPAVSQAKPPVKAVTASPVVGDQPPGDDADDEAHRKYFDSRERAARQGRRAS